MQAESASQLTSTLTWSFYDTQARYSFETSSEFNRLPMLRPLLGFFIRYWMTYIRYILKEKYIQIRLRYSLQPFSIIWILWFECCYLNIFIWLLLFEHLYLNKLIWFLLCKYFIWIYVLNCCLSNTFKYKYLFGSVHHFLQMVTIL